MNTRIQSTTTHTYTLTLVGTNGQQSPVGEYGRLNEFHVFPDWTMARAALANAVAKVGLESVHAVAVVMTQTLDGKMGDFCAGHYSQNEVRELCETRKHAKPGPSVTRADGRRVSVSIPK